MNDNLSPDEMATKMRYHAEQILELCSSLERACCRGESIKCPFFYVSCSKLMNILEEFLKPNE